MTRSVIGTVQLLVSDKSGVVRVTDVPQVLAMASISGAPTTAVIKQH